MVTGPVNTPPRRDPDFEVDVLRYVWRTWRAQASHDTQLESVTLHTVGLSDRDARPMVRVEWSSPREDGHPVHVLCHPIPCRADADPEAVGDEIVWALWATAHGTS
jgi:hypothetical protein